MKIFTGILLFIFPIYSQAYTCEFEAYVLYTANTLLVKVEDNYRSVRYMVKHNQMTDDDLKMSKLQLTRTKKLYKDAHNLYMSCYRKDMI